MSQVFIEFREDGPNFLSSTKEIEATVAGIDVGGTFTVRDLRLVLNPKSAPKSLGTMNCVEQAGEDKPPKYKRTFDPHDLEDECSRYHNQTCKNCGHNRRVPICAILHHAAFSKTGSQQ